MIDLVVKLLIVTFTLAIGGCFALWPGEVSRRFHRRRSPSAESPEDQRMDMRHHVEMIWLRQLGLFLISLTCYVIYLWIKMG